MKLNCIIIDDEQPARELLQNYCSKIDSLHLVGSYKTPIHAIDILQQENIDILFIDIQMPDISGLDFIKSIKTHHTKVIFTTAYREYALESYELDAIDYLVKPIEFHRFLRAVEKVKEVHIKRNEVDVQKKEETIIIRANKKLYRLPISDILYIKSENEYVKYVTKNHGNLLVHGALKDVIKTLESHTDFIRIHRSYIVNVSCIDYVEGNSIRINNEFFPISDSYKNAFFDVWK
ncbi:LytR/AlgR family response regulator transcription factor [Tenacibaculum amylolyticum]|uniref:LytR/AlgR family response regulator transcription factor n=1 Tax=Tenacibaculum amylolyticum TaxID=104269 RepID=UPI003895F62A